MDNTNILTVSIDTEREYTLEELKKKRDELQNISNKLRNLITNKEIEQYNFENKFVYSENYGYMYVQWQVYESNTDINYGQHMFFQGIGFKSSYSPYKDDSYCTYDASEEWNYPIKMFISDVESGKFREITKEEFLLNAEKSLLQAHKEFEKQVNNIKQGYIEFK